MRAHTFIALCVVRSLGCRSPPPLLLPLRSSSTSACSTHSVRSAGQRSAVSVSASSTSSPAEAAPDLASHALLILHSVPGVLRRVSPVLPVPEVRALLARTVRLVQCAHTATARLTEAARTTVLDRAEERPHDREYGEDEEEEEEGEDEDVVAASAALLRLLTRYRDHPALIHFLCEGWTAAAAARTSEERPQHHDRHHHQQQQRAEDSQQRGVVSDDSHGGWDTSASSSPAACVLPAAAWSLLLRSVAARVELLNLRRFTAVLASLTPLSAHVRVGADRRALLRFVGLSLRLLARRPPVSDSAPLSPLLTTLSAAERHWLGRSFSLDADTWLALLSDAHALIDVASVERSPALPVLCAASLALFDWGAAQALAPSLDALLLAVAGLGRPQNGQENVERAVSLVLAAASVAAGGTSTAVAEGGGSGVRLLRAILDHWRPRASEEPSDVAACTALAHCAELIERVSAAPAGSVPVPSPLLREWTALCLSAHRPEAAHSLPALYAAARLATLSLQRPEYGGADHADAALDVAQRLSSAPRVSVSARATAEEAPASAALSLLGSAVRVWPWIASSAAHRTRVVALCQALLPRLVQHGGAERTLHLLAVLREVGVSAPSAAMAPMVVEALREAGHEAEALRLFAQCAASTHPTGALLEAALPLPSVSSSAAELRSWMRAMRESGGRPSPSLGRAVLRVLRRLQPHTPREALAPLLVDTVEALLHSAPSTAPVSTSPSTAAPWPSASVFAELFSLACSLHVLECTAAFLRLRAQLGYTLSDEAARAALTPFTGDCGQLVSTRTAAQPPHMKTPRQPRARQALTQRVLSVSLSLPLSLSPALSHPFYPPHSCRFWSWCRRMPCSPTPSSASCARKSVVQSSRAEALRAPGALLPQSDCRPSLEASGR